MLLTDGGGGFVRPSRYGRMVGLKLIWHERKATLMSLSCGPYTLDDDGDGSWIHRGPTGTMFTLFEVPSERSVAGVSGGGVGLEQVRVSSPDEARELFTRFQDRW